MNEALDVSYGRDTHQVIDVRWPTGTGPFPTVLCIHGGFYGDEDRIHGIAEDLTAAGFCTVAVGFRSAAGGHLADTLADIRAAMEATGDQAAVGSPWGILGASLGGYLTALTVVADPTEFKAVATLSGLMNPETFHEQGVGKRLIGCDQRDCPEKWDAFDPVKHVTSAIPPWLLTNSTQERVPMSQPQEMMAALDSVGVKNELITVQGDHHAQQSWIYVHEQVVAFFQEHLVSGGTSVPEGTERP